MKTRHLVNRTARELGFRYPVSVAIHKGDGVTEDWAGYHMLRRRRHRIAVGSRPDRGFYNILAHEMAHALTTELYPDAEMHGTEFKIACLHIALIWAEWGIPLEGIYDPELDL
jgi:hypothetical protein